MCCHAEGPDGGGLRVWAVDGPPRHPHHHVHFLDVRAGGPHAARGVNPFIPRPVVHCPGRPGAGPSPPRPPVPPPLPGLRRPRRMGPPQGVLLEGEGGRWGPLPSGYGAVTVRKRLGGGYRRLEMRLGLVLGYGNAFGVASGPECYGVLPTPLQAIPWSSVRGTLRHRRDPCSGLGSGGRANASSAVRSDGP